MWWVELLIGFGGAVLGAAVAVVLERLRADRETVERTSFNVYMLLLDAAAQHFWICSAEMRGTIAAQAVRVAFDRLRWRISDELRKVAIPETEEAYDALLSLRFRTESDRSKALDALIDKLGRRVNPRAVKALQAVSKESQSLMVGNLDEFFRRKNKLDRLDPGGGEMFGSGNGVPEMQERERSEDGAGPRRGDEP